MAPSSRVQRGEIPGTRPAAPRAMRRRISRADNDETRAQRTSTNGGMRSSVGRNRPSSPSGQWLDRPGPGCPQRRALPPARPGRRRAHFLSTLGHRPPGRGLGALGPQAGWLGPLGRESVLCLLDAVLAERSHSPSPPELVWTGPEGRAGESRDTAVVVQQLFERAQQTVTIAGFRFDHGAALLAPLHSAMRDRGVTCRIYADGPEAESLVKRNWPFGPPLPEVLGFIAPNGVYAAVCEVRGGRPPARLRDVRHNFTERGHERNIEVGVLLTDPALAELLEGQLNGPRRAGCLSGRADRYAGTDTGIHVENLRQSD